MQLHTNISQICEQIHFLFQPVCGVILSGILPRCFPPFLAVWGGQTERETPLCNIKLHAARVRVCVGLAALVGVLSGVSWQDTLHGLGFKTAAMALRDDTLPLSDPRLEKEPKLAVVLGTEGDGLANTTIEHCDYTVKIPMSHGVDSLNVAAASAVAFYQLGTLHNKV